MNKSTTKFGKMVDSTKGSTPRSEKLIILMNGVDEFLLIIKQKKKVTQC